MTTTTTEMPTAVTIEFTHAELTVMQDILGRQAEGIDASSIAATSRQLGTALQKCNDGMLATQPEPVTPEGLADRLKISLADAKQIIDSAHAPKG